MIDVERKTIDGKQMMANT